MKITNCSPENDANKTEFIKRQNTIVLIVDNAYLSLGKLSRTRESHWVSLLPWDSLLKCQLHILTFPGKAKIYWESGRESGNPRTQGIRER